MKLELVTKLDKTNMATTKVCDDDFMSANGDVMAFFPIYGRFAAIRKLDSGRMIYKTYIFINNNLYLTKREDRTEKSLTQLSYYFFE